MKILYYSSHPNLNLASPAGYGTHMREMIKAFTGLGHDVKPVIMGGTRLSSSSLEIKPRNPLKRLISSAIPVYFWESAKDYRLNYFDKYAFRTLEKEIQRFQPEVIYERASYLQTSGVRAAVKYKIKHVLEVNAPYSEERVQLQGNSFFASKGVKAEKIQLEASDRIAVVSSALLNHLSSTYNVVGKKFILTPNAINPSSINYSVKKAELLKSDLKLEDRIVLGFVGSIFPWHGLDLLIKAFKVIYTSKASVHLLIIGDGETLPLLKKIAHQEGIQEQITFTGNVNHQDVFNYIACMDVCIMATSNWYGSPVKIFEYGAMGKAVIAPDNVPVRDVMEDGVSGLLVEPNVESLINGITKFLENEELRKSCALEFKNQVLQKYTWVNNAKMILSGLQ